MQKILLKMHHILLNHFGPLHWWPGSSPFEIIIGAILTQNTSWKNVEKAIQNLKNRKILHPKALHIIDEKELSLFIKPSGYFNLKAKRLKNFLEYFMNNYKGDTNIMFLQDGKKLRKDLLTINGIGPETADSILLYAGNKPFFVVDAYTKRIFSRHHFISNEKSYQYVQELFMKNLPKNVELFNEFHAQIVMLGKYFCTKINPKCKACPINYLKKTTT